MKKHYTEYLSSSQERPDIQHHLFQSIEPTTLPYRGMELTYLMMSYTVLDTIQNLTW